MGRASNSIIHSFRKIPLYGRGECFMNRRLVCCAISAVILALCTAPFLFAESPLVFRRDGTNMACPPTNTSGAIDPANRPEDQNISGRVGPGASNDWLLLRYHWDDGKGKDLTVEQWCLSSPHVFTMRIIQSVNGEQFVRATPTGTGGTVPVGTC